LTSGRRNFAAIAVVARGRMDRCLAALPPIAAEYAPEAEVWVADSRAPAKVRSFQFVIVAGAFVEVPQA